jgi:aminoglycoside phosphotransferase (APT) family kinase protein
MQPEFETYLRGIRRELLQAAEETRAGGDELRALAYQRTAEAALQLSVRWEQLPSILARLLPRLDALLRTTVSAMQSRSIAVPGTASAALAARGGDDAEAGIARWNELGFGLADCIAELSRRPANVPAMTLSSQTNLAAAALEQELRDARAAAGAAIDASTPASATAEERPVSDAAITAFLRERLPQYPDVHARGVRRQIGFNTKEIFFFEIGGHPDWPRHAVLRRNRACDSVGNLVADEFELLQFLYREGVAVARPLIADSGNAHIERSFLISEKLPGKAHVMSKESAASAATARDMALRLAALHRLDPATIPRSRVLYAGGPRERTLAMVDRFYRLTRESWYEPSLTLEAAFAWLRANVDCIGPQTVIVHGDYDCRNLLFDGDRLSAILDWELAHLGHPAEDLAYCKPQIEAVMDWHEFLRLYESAGGTPVRDVEVAYFEIYNDAFRISTMRSATRNYLLGRHTDILIGMAGLIEQPEHLSRVVHQLAAQGVSR